jgi:hypothetical protein
MGTKVAILETSLTYTGLLIRNVADPIQTTVQSTSHNGCATLHAATILNGTHQLLIHIHEVNSSDENKQHRDSHGARDGSVE